MDCNKFPFLRQELVPALGKKCKCRVGTTKAVFQSTSIGLPLSKLEQRTGDHHNIHYHG